MGERLCLIHEDSLAVFPCRLYEDGKVGAAHVMFREFLDQRGFTCLPITEDERLGGHLNVVVTEAGAPGGGLRAGRPDRRGAGRHGFDLATFPADELFMGKGGAHCMTCPVLVG